MIADMTWGQFSLAWLMIFFCGLLILIVLIQRGRGGGLSGAFGGGGGGGGAFGAKTGDVFTWITVVVAIIFVLLGIGLNFAFDVRPPAVDPVITSAPVIPAAPGSTTTSDLPITIETLPIPSGGGLELPPTDSIPTTEKTTAGDTPQDAGDAGSTGGDTPAGADAPPEQPDAGPDTGKNDTDAEPKKPEPEKADNTSKDGADTPGS